MKVELKGMIDTISYNQTAISILAHNGFIDNQTEMDLQRSMTELQGIYKKLISEGIERVEV
jgi:hypothetical protein